MKKKKKILWWIIHQGNTMTNKKIFIHFKNMQQFKSEHVLTLIIAAVLAYFLLQQFKPFAAKKEACCGRPDAPMY